MCRLVVDEWYWTARDALLRLAEGVADAVGPTLAALLRDCSTGGQIDALA